MATRVTSRDVQEIVAKLSSDKAKARDEGIKLLNTWLEGERSIGFCRFVSEKTSMLKPNDIPHSETWPFLVKTLIQCLSLEISSSKKRLPKLNLAKTLRIVVQRAEDDRSSGKSPPLLPVARVLFNHVWDVLKDVPSFQSEYGIILRHLLAVADYRFHMRKRVYSNLVLLYMEKIETSLSTENIGQLNPKEEVFRFTLTLQSLLENPPGDIPEELRDDMIKGFIGMFSHVRDEGKNSRKLVECINIYLVKDGPNLGCKSLEIHEAVQQFVFRCWFATHDRSLKDALVCYVKLQLSLTRGVVDGTASLEQLLDIVSKELDQMSTSSANIPRSDSTRDEKCGFLTSSQHSVVELAALVFWRACSNTSKTAASADKRARQEHVVVQLKERLMEGKWSWHAAFCCLIRNYSTRIRKDFFIYLFESVSKDFERIINNVNLVHSYDDLSWTLRSLLRLSSMLLFDAPNVESSPKSSCAKNEVEKSWHVIWSCLMRCLPSFVNVTSVVDAAFMLLCNIMLSDTTDSYFVSPDIWDLRVFKRLPSISVLCFISCYFSRRASQGDPRDAFYLRQNMLRAVLALVNLKECSSLNDRLVIVVPAAAYALCVGSAPLLNEALGLSPLLYGSKPMEEGEKVGYIVGLGDRHSMNVLIDQVTAEVVHIDLGVAFEQGLMLKTPERVPFRLTRDIMDGMGVTGVEGVFRRCSEETLSVMRTNKEALLTIIEVFIHDPLYKWALSPLKAMQRRKDIDDDLDASLEDSDDDEYEGNKDAARALLRVKQKLDGYEDGEMRSVNGQVQQLIQDAIDPDRLCHMFPGWGAWL